MIPSYLKQLFLILLLALAGGTDVFAQSVSLIQYTTEHGLPSNNVYYVYRDRKGFLWFATDKGLARYNGIEFQQFTVMDGLPDNEIFYLREDYEGRMWMQTYNGKLCFYKDGKFFTDKNTNYLRLPMQTHHINGIILGKDSTVVMLFEDRNKFVAVKKNRSRVFDITNLSKAYGNCLSARFDAPNRLMVRFGSCDVMLDTMGRKLSTTYYKGRQTQTINSSSGILLMDTTGLYDWRNDKLYTFPEKIGASDLILAYLGADRQLYCTRDGAYVSTGETLLKGKIITGACTDINGDYWLSTYRHGAYRLSKRTDAIVSYELKTIPDRKAFESRNGVLYYICPRTTSLCSFRDGETKVLFNKCSPLNPTDVGQFFPFALAGEKGIFLLDSNRRVAYVEEGKVLTYPYTGVITSLSYGKNRIFGSTSYSVSLIELGPGMKPEDAKLRTLIPELPRKRIVTKAMDRFGDFWYCTPDSLFRIRRDSYEPEVQTSGGVFRRMFFSGDYLVAYDDNNQLYVYRVQQEGLRLIRRFRDNRFFWGDIFDVGRGKVIISTNSYYQLLTLNDTTEKCLLQPLEDPFIPRNAVYIYSDSTSCYFVGASSVTKMPMSYIFKTAYAPIVLFTQLRVGQHSYPITGQMILPPSESHNLSIGFEGISFLSRNIKYQYSISEMASEADNWIDIDGKSINLASPGYTTYYIRLRAKGMSGNYSAPVSMKLTILRPFWMEWWFIALTVLGVIALITFVVRSIILLTLRRRRRLHELESRYHAAEYKTLNALMNPHFIFNSLNNIKGLVSRDDKKAANKFLTNFSGVIRQNMQNLSKETVSLYEELELITRYLELEKLRFGEYINYRISISPDVDPEEVNIPPLLIQPLVENAVKHGLLPRLSEGNLITINVHSRARSVFIDIIDNGVGLSNSKATEHEGFDSLGLQNIEKRISYLRQLGKKQIFFTIKELWEDGSSKGTIASIEIID